MARIDDELLGTGSARRLGLPELLERVGAFASSRPGKDLITSIEPTRDPARARALLEETSEMGAILQTGAVIDLSGLEELTPFLGGNKESADRALSARELALVRFVLDRSRLLRGQLVREDSPHLSARGERLVDLPELRERLENSLDQEGEVLDSASEQLALHRKRIGELQREVREWMEKRRESRSLRKVLQDDVISVRNGRLVFQVRTECRSQVRGILHGESGSGQTLFIEPEGVARLGDELDRERGMERREVSRIVAELTREIFLHRDEILSLHLELAHLDACRGKARFGSTFGCVVPEIGDSRSFRLVSARHPLLIWRERGDSGGLGIDLERVRREVVPLDIELDGSSFQLVVTGPNTGGKTVALKTAGLLALMVSCGIPVPAGEGTTIPCFDRVLADIGDEQSLEQNLSTFSSHVTVIAQILQRVSSRSLVVIDEIGAGTDPLEGAALAEAVLDRLYERGVMVIVSTHLGRLKEFAFRRKKCQNASMQFDPETLAPTYLLQTGLPGRSNALVIAERIGMPPDVIDKATLGVEGEERIDPEVIAGLERTRTDLERLNREAEKSRSLARDLASEASKQKEEAYRTRMAVDYEAERSEEERVLGAVARIEEVIDGFDHSGADIPDLIAKLRQAIAGAKERTRLAERRIGAGLALRKGDVVFVPRFQEVCEVTRINKGKQRLTVDLHGVATEINFLDISSVLPPPGHEVRWKCDEGLSREDP